MKRLLPLVGLAGVLFLAVGGVIYAIKGAMEVYVVALLWIGLLSILFYFYVGFASIRDALTGRSAKYGANTAIMIIVFFMILALASYMSTRYKVRWDMTATKRYTLSDQTKKLVKSLKREVTAIAFYRSDERTRQKMQDLLQEISQLSPKFKFRFIDPDKQPGAAAKHGITSYRTTLLKSGNNQQTIGYESEEKFINALLKVTTDEVKTIYFLKGHGENNTSDIQSSGYKGIKEEVEKENRKVKDINLMETGALPDDCALLIISGPKKDLLADELTKLTAYIERGGSILFMIDPGGFPVTTEYLSGYGFTLGNDVIIDKMSQVFGANYLVPVVTQYEEKHPITGEFNIQTFFPLARSVTVERTPEKGSFPLALTGDASWGETNINALYAEEGTVKYDDKTDKKGPLSIAAVKIVEVTKGAEKSESGDKKRYAKLVVVGDSDYVNNTHVNLAGNKDFFLNTVNWLMEEAELISVRKKVAGVTPVILTATQARFIFWIPVVVLPSFVLFAGIAVLTRRRLK
ncbi:MAG: GldG family protein [Proteobacteria bacterium]|nr:GldG family protein [Pseudomonadota bacterium]